MTSASVIRQSFIDFYRKEDHQQIDSSPLTPMDDPSLLFTNSGMVQFKSIFTGLKQAAYPRAVTVQKCMRAGGKHNDLENVGYTARHHTFFEMLGNFSFGDYFKEHAIGTAWRFVTRELALPHDRLYVTVYRDDESAADIWRRVSGLPEQRIIRIGGDDNFWQMGETGPCGPCSEIFYDHGPAVAGGPPGSPDEDGDRYVEIWNLVFMQYETLASKERRLLPRPSIDTGMGLERITAVLQGKHNNFETDLFTPVLARIAKITGVDPGDPQARASCCVLADHVRAAGFLLAEGVTPANEGRGYVLRRIIRRAVRHGHKLGYEQPLLAQLVPAMIGTFGGFYPELRQGQALIESTLVFEESRFRQTLERGMRLLQDAFDRLPAGGVLDGGLIFKLYDQCGFPGDLTADCAREQGFSIDQSGFEAEMSRQRQRSRAAWRSRADQNVAPVWYRLAGRVPATEFLGYSSTVGTGFITAIVGDETALEQADSGEVWLILSQSPFYAEAGGQLGDSGILTGEQGAHAVIVDTQKLIGGLTGHRVRIAGGQIRVGQSVRLRVDHHRRRALCRNHSATHLLHAALRQILGSEVVQRGSLVSPQLLRFDFALSRPAGDEALAAVTRLVNDQILAAAPVKTEISSPEQAMAGGAMALFGEKYGNSVRVVTMGQAAFSKELCGGTHVANTGQIGLCQLTQETGVGAGIRRIEAVTGPEVINWYQSGLAARDQALAAAHLRLKEAGKAAESMRVKLAETTAGQELQLADITVYSKLLDNIPPGELKKLSDPLKQRYQQVKAVIILAATHKDKASILVAVCNGGRQLDAVKLAAAAVGAIGGSGVGGRPVLAQTGGGNPRGIKSGVNNIIRLLRQDTAAEAGSEKQV